MWSCEFFGYNRFDTIQDAEFACSHDEMCFGYFPDEVVKSDGTKETVISLCPYRGRDDKMGGTFYNKTTATWNELFNNP